MSRRLLPCLEHEYQRNVARSLAVLEHSRPNEFDTLRALFDAALNEQDKKNRILEGTQLLQGQGAAQVLEELQVMLSDPEGLLKNFSDSQE